MTRILITSGPTREYLDPVRYLSNGSSGRMGSALAAAAIASGHDVVVVSGPVTVTYPDAAEVVTVVSTQEMLAASRRQFPSCDGMIAAAAPCDYRPEQIVPNKIRKTGQPIDLRLVETPDIVATLGQQKKVNQWIVGFALETEDVHRRAMVKLKTKQCDLIVVNGPHAIDAVATNVELLAPDGHPVATLAGTKTDLAKEILAIINQRLVG